MNKQNFEVFDDIIIRTTTSTFRQAICVSVDETEGLAFFILNHPLVFDENKSAEDLVLPLTDRMLNPNSQVNMGLIALPLDIDRAREKGYKFDRLTENLQNQQQ